MIDYSKWDEYYDGGFADEEPVNNFNEEYDERSELEKLEYGGQKTNVTAKQIMQETGTTAISDGKMEKYCIVSEIERIPPAKIQMTYL